MTLLIFEVIPISSYFNLTHKFPKKFQGKIRYLGIYSISSLSNILKLSRIYLRTSELIVNVQILYIDIINRSSGLKRALLKKINIFEIKVTRAPTNIISQFSKKFQKKN